MRKILILNGAGKKNGNTALRIRSFREGAEAAGHEIKEFFLQSMNIYGGMYRHTIIAGFENFFPETGVNIYRGLSSPETLRVLSGKMAPFIRAIPGGGEYEYKGDFPCLRPS